MQTEYLPGTGPTFLDFAMCARQALTIYHERILSPADSPVRTSATPDGEPELTESDPASGLSMPESFASYDPAMSSWRTSQRSLFGGWIEFSETWPRSGTMRNGSVYRRPPLVPRTAETDSSLWHTPNVPNGGRVNPPEMSPTGKLPNGKKRQVGLEHQVRMVERQLWPTPRSSDADRGGRGDLIQAVRGNPNSHYKLWPTPTTADGMGGPGNSGRSGGLNLRTAVAQWPTPTARDWRSGHASDETHAKNSRPLNEVVAREQGSGQLNPTWVEWLMGFPLGWTDLKG